MDGDEAGVRALERILGSVLRADLRSTADPHAAATLYADFKPDLILFDLQPPNMDGFDLLRTLRRQIPAEARVAIVAMIADTAADAKHRALLAGAKDVVAKPFEAAEVQASIANLLEIRALYDELENRLQTRARTLEGAHLETVERLALALEYREDGIGGHTRRVGQGSALLARALGLPQAEVMLLRQAAPLHDVGKIAIPDRILLKKDRLSPQEWDVVKTHTTIGAKIAAGAQHSLLLTAEAIALSHHERWDGRGYPRALAGEAIVLPARIVAVADAFDAMTHARPWRDAHPEDYALAELERCAGAHFDPRCVECFLRVLKEPAARSLLGLPERGALVGR
ncbi:MAG TPA: HD domain-containing phosphohydrolase [bacterium]|nr:HD domain-containing phosphohydrolase [bacterium]